MPPSRHQSIIRRAPPYRSYDVLTPPFLSSIPVSDIRNCCSAAASFQPYVLFSYITRYKHQIIKYQLTEASDRIVKIAVRDREFDDNYNSNRYNIIKVRIP